MPGARKYKPLDSDESSPSLPHALPTEQPIAVYYRQSSMAQVGNISTDMQQIDLPNYVISLGWHETSIILIDEDEGVSGAKRIDERRGMSRLYDLIISQQIRAVAVQAEDRLFRDETQIQVNVFIDACVRNDVRIITPYFKYNLGDKYEGPYHRLLFRMRAEQAADYLNTYVKGRLVAAKERMLLQGLWMGGNINLGYMVDDRKTLQNGLPNPAWRKYKPFESCADVVVKIFETFVMLGGNQRATLRYLYDNGPHFPDFDDPELLSTVPHGFIWRKPIRMLKRDNIYAVGSVQLQNMLTNAVYLGHWIYKDRVVQWNNHPAIVPEDLFFNAFNYLSKYNFDGTPNTNYAPRMGRKNHTTKKQKRNIPEPTYTGLMISPYNGEMRNVTTSWRKSMKTYAYVCSFQDSADTQQYLWSRRADYFDQLIDEMLHAKLRVTFNAKVWDGVLSDSGHDFAKEERRLKQQLTSVEQKLATLLSNFAHVQSASLIASLEQEYRNLEQEQIRLQTQLDKLNERKSEQQALIDLASQTEAVLDNWQVMATEEKNAVARIFIDRIVILQEGRHRVADAEIYWRDGSKDEFQVPYRSNNWKRWSDDEVELLSCHIENQADQITISQSLPGRNWHAIRIKAREILGVKNMYKFHFTPKPIRDRETFKDYQLRISKQGNEANRTSGNRWTEDELETLEELINTGATQLEICAALPLRTWEAIQKKIRQLHGVGVIVPGNRPVASHERIEDYLERDPEAAGAMPFLVLASSIPQRRN